MNTPLDSILSGDRASAPAPESAPQLERQEAPTNGAEQQPQPSAEAEPEQHELPDGRKTVPIEALHAERGRVKRYTEQVASFEQSLKDRDAAWERRMAQLVDAVKPKPAPQQAPDFYDNPAAATQHAVAPHFEKIEERLQAIAKDTAISRFSEAEVDEAEKAFIDDLQAQKLDPADYHKVVGSPNRFAAAVQWHKRKMAQAEIGDDPAAYRAKVEAEVLAKHGLAPPANGAAPQQQLAQVMPSNLASARNVGARSGPAWAGPKPLEDIFKR